MDSDGEIDLSILNMYDKTCIKILDKSPSVHLYNFNKNDTAWDKSDIGGVFFVCKHSKSPQYSFLILNRKNPKTNINEPITPAIQFQICSPFILYKNVNGGIFSIWFYSKEDCSRIGSLLNRLKGNEAVGIGDGSVLSSLQGLALSAKPQQLETSLVAPAQVSPRMGLDAHSVSHSFSKFVSLVQQNKENDQAPNLLTHTIKQQHAEDQQQQHPPSDPESVGRNTIPDMLSSAEVEFKRSSQNGSNKSVNNSGSHVNQFFKDMKPIKGPQCQAALDLRMIENFSPLGHPREDAPLEKCQFYVSDLEKDMLESEQLLLPPKSTKLNQDFPIPEFISTPLYTSKRDEQQQATTASIRQTTPLLITAYRNGKPSLPATATSAGTCDSLNKANSSRQSTALRRGGEELPTRLNASVTADTDAGYLEDNEEELEDEEVKIRPGPSAHTSEAFITPMLGIHNVMHPVASLKSTLVEGLSKGQLKSALLHLIEKDENFLTTVHNAYVASLNSHLN